mgnify:CR=1 FL=1
MSFAASTPARLNFSNGVCSTQGLSAKVRARFRDVSFRGHLGWNAAVSLSLPLDKKSEKNDDDARDSRRRDIVRRKNSPNSLTYTQAPMRTAKAFPSLKIENRVVVRRSTFSSRRFHFLRLLGIQPNPVSLFLLKTDSFYAFGEKAPSVLQISCH